MVHRKLATFHQKGCKQLAVSHPKTRAHSDHNSQNVGTGALTRPVEHGSANPRANDQAGENDRNVEIS